MAENSANATIPSGVVSELKQDALLINNLGDTLAGEPTLETPGTRAHNALRKLNISIKPREKTDLGIRSPEPTIPQAVQIV